MKKTEKKSLRKALTYNFILAVTMPIIITACIVLYNQTSDFVEQHKKQNHIQTDAFIHEFRGFLNEPRILLETIAGVIGVSQTFDYEIASSILDDVIEKSGIFDSVYILDEKGAVLSADLPAGSNGRKKQLIDLKCIHVELFEKATKSGKATWSDIFVSCTDIQEVIAVAVPLNNGGAIIGNLRTERLSDFIASLGEIHCDVLIFDKNGGVVAHNFPDHEHEIATLDTLPILQAAINGERSSGEFLLDQSSHIGTAIALPQTNWVALVYQNSDAIYLPLQRTAATFAIAFLLALAAAAFFAVSRAKALSQPLTKLSKQVSSVEGGTYDIDLPDLVYSEVDILGKRFVKMAGAIREREYALNESGRQYRHLAESTNAVPWEYDFVNDRFSYIGPQAANLLGYPMAKWTELSFWISIIHSDDLEQTLSSFMDCIFKGVDHELTYRIVKPDGQIVWILDKGSLIKTEGDITRMVGFFVDITKNKVAEEESRELKARLMKKQKLEAVGTLAGGIAHDFNNILSAILGYTELTLPELPEDAPEREYLTQILIAVNRARDVVKQMLAFSRMRSGKPSPASIQPVVDESLKLLRASIPSTIEFTTEIDAHCPEVLADATQIQQIIMNLCINASHAIGHDVGEITISLECGLVTKKDALEIAPGRYAQLRVSDTGEGIANEVIDKIFDPYFTTKKVGQGSGLGLAVVHGIVSSCDGQITVESHPGAGSTFTVYLPLISE